MRYLTEEHNAWCDRQLNTAVEILRDLGKIPAPSHDEGRRAAFVRDLLIANGAERVWIDDAQNVILAFGDIDAGPIDVVMAHTDIVFPDTEELPLREADGRMYAPGIGDDTANLVNLMVASKYLSENKIVPEKGGLLVVADSCEEGLGNLKGSKRIVADYGNRMRRLIALDLYLGKIADKTVGSHRYRITVKTRGGHSYGDFGNSNAIAIMAHVITRLYAKRAPEKAKTTYNVGVINGGTTVNSICSECSILYEYRSEDRECLQEMRTFLEETISEMRAYDCEISVEQIGDRPCMGDVDPVQEAALEDAMAELMYECTGKQPETGAALSTDCNSAAAAGIPCVCMGTVSGAGMHTRNEWIEIDSMRQGLWVALGVLLYCCKE